MNFCEDCDNLLEIKIIEAEDLPASSLGFYCKTCNKTYEGEEAKKIIKDKCVYSINYNTDSIKRDSVINQYTHLDVTLPRVKNVKCPNSECPSANPEVSYIKYDEEKMKYIYICCDCLKASKEPSSWYLD